MEPDTFPFLVIGNKVDMDKKRVVGLLEAEIWCEENGLRHYECSAKENWNVADAFK